MIVGSPFLVHVSGVLAEPCPCIQAGDSAAVVGLVNDHADSAVCHKDFDHATAPHVLPAAAGAWPWRGGRGRDGGGKHAIEGRQYPR